MKKLGFGLMRLPLTDPNVPTSIDLEQTEKMVDSFIEQGFTYFDTAWMYCGHASEDATGKALVARYPRDAFTLADKLHAGFIKTKEDRDLVFEEQRRKTGVDFFDYYLIHDIVPKHYEIYQRLDCFNWLREKKAAGLVKHMGFSFHGDAELLEQVLTEQPDMDFVQLQINYLDWDSESIQSRKCYEVARRHGLPVVVMEPVKGGTLAKLPPAAEALLRAAHPNWSIPSWAIRFAASLDGVMMVLSGMSNVEQLADNTAYMADFKPLNEEELTLISRVVEILNSSAAIPCTGCAYCVEGCPQNIAIPQYFSLYNDDLKNPASQTAAYRDLTNTFGKPSDCIGCGQCESACPQQLPIIKHLLTVTEHFKS